MELLSAGAVFTDVLKHSKCCCIVCPQTYLTHDPQGGFAVQIVIMALRLPTTLGIVLVGVMSPQQ